ncbi:MAG: hypothetical protein R2730_15655 [Chitinophagales bacterium]
MVNRFIFLALLLSSLNANAFDLDDILGNALNTLIDGLSGLERQLMDDADYLTSQRVDQMRISIYNAQYRLSHDLDKNLSGIDKNIVSYLQRVEQMIDEGANAFKTSIADFDVIVNAALKNLCVSLSGLVCVEKQIPWTIHRIEGKVQNYHTIGGYYIMYLHGDALNTNSNKVKWETEVIIGTGNNRQVIKGEWFKSNVHQIKIPFSALGKEFKNDECVISPMQIVVTKKADRGFIFRKIKTDTLVSIPTSVMLLPILPVKIETIQESYKTDDWKTCDNCIKYSKERTINAGETLSFEVELPIDQRIVGNEYGNKPKDFSLYRDEGIQFGILGLDNIHRQYERQYLDCKNFDKSLNNTKLTAECKYNIAGTQRPLDEPIDESFITTKEPKTSIKVRIWVKYETLKSNSIPKSKVLQIIKTTSATGINQNYLSYGDHFTEALFDKKMSDYAITLVPFYWLNEPIEKIVISNSVASKNIIGLGKVSCTLDAGDQIRISFSPLL